jgi:RNA polymerase sigma-70 factor (ECF subfamily)
VSPIWDLVWVPEKRLASLSHTRHGDQPLTASDQEGALLLEDAKLVAGVRARDPEALARFHERFARPVQRILYGILGRDRELEDVHHDVFVRALGALSELRDPAALSGFVRAITVNTARACLERRIRRRRWLFLSAGEELPEPEPADPGPGHEARAAVQAAYAVLARLPVPERIAFSLRHFEQMELTEVASACDVSLASIKRRLSRAEARFLALAKGQAELVELLEGGARWTRS